MEYCAATGHGTLFLHVFSCVLVIGVRPFTLLTFRIARACSAWGEGMKVRLREVNFEALLLN